MKFSDFGFKENPFSITPDPRYLFLSRGHEESLAHLIYGTGPNGGFVQLTGEVGTGKTMLVRSLLEQKLENVDIALILNPRLSERDFLAAICDELGIALHGPPYQLKQLNDALNRHLLTTHEQGRHTVLVIDEAQNLSPNVLEQIRLLTNLETARHKLLRIILVGQPELQQLLARKDLRQVDQRITARYHLSPLSRAETARYIRHRLRVAGVSEDLFSHAAVWLVHNLTGGVPRKINTLCERALLAVFTRGAKRVSLPMIWRSWREIRGGAGARSGWTWVVAGVLVAFSATSVWWGMQLIEPLNSDHQVKAEQSEEIERSDDSQALSSPVSKPGTPHSESAIEEILRNAERRVEPVIQESPASESESDEESSQDEVSRRLYAKFYALWGKSPDTQGVINLCHQARGESLRCLKDSTDWGGLLKLDRPFLSGLQHGDLTRSVLVSGLRAEEVTLYDGHRSLQMSKERFLGRWRGEFVMLWRPPEGVALIGPGTSGKAVTWLRERLSLADGEPLPTVIGVDHFESKLKQRLRRFQQAQGLIPDGLAGAWTMILLNNLDLPPGTPTLRSGD